MLLLRCGGLYTAKDHRKKKKTGRYHCEETGHLIRDCPKGKGKDIVQDFPEGKACSHGRYTC